MNFIKRIFEEKIDEFVHQQFQKFSKGEFKNRGLIRARRSGKEDIINTSAEFANELVRIVAEKLGSRKTKVTGCIVSTRDLKGELDFKEVKQFQGVKRYFIDGEISGNEIVALLKKYPQSFFALSFNAEDNELKIKPKAPKSSKTKNKDEEPKADFCKLKTKDKKIAESFVFEKPDFKQAEINHTFLITDLIMPKGETDFAKIREMTKRKGRIIRKGKIDEQEIREEKEFEA